MSDTISMLMRRPARLAFLAAVFALLAFAAPAALAQVPPGVQEQPEAAPPQPARRRDLLSRLNLTAEQLQQLREIRRQSEEEGRELARRARLARRALDEAIYADALDEAAVGARSRELAAAQTALVTLRAQTEMRVRRVLTPEQLQTFRELRQHARRRQRTGPFRHARPPREPDDDAGDPPSPARRGNRRP